MTLPGMPYFPKKGLLGARRRGMLDTFTSG